jgi:hypothetical protein
VRIEARCSPHTDECLIPLRKRKLTNPVSSLSSRLAQTISDSPLLMRPLQRRCELMCEVAEAFAVCGEVNRTNELFAAIQTELPVSLAENAFPDGFLSRKRGVKQRMLRGCCLAGLVLGLGKAATRPRGTVQRSARPSEPKYQAILGEEHSLNSNQHARIKEVTAACECGDAKAALRAASPKTSE